MRCVLLWLLGNSQAVHYSTALSTESIFTAISTAAVLVLIATERRGTVAPQWARWLMFGCILVGLAYWVRYAGIFLLAATLAYYGVSALIRRDRPLMVLACIGVSAGFVAAGMLRNILITSSWKGGNTKEVFHPVIPIVKEFVLSIFHLTFGGHAALSAGIVYALLVLFVMALGVSAVCMLRAHKVIASGFGGYNGPLLMMWTYFGIYTAGMIYLGLFSVISFGTRMFYPLLPLLLLVLGRLVSLIFLQRIFTLVERRILVATAIVATCVYLVINMRSILITAEMPPHRVVEFRLAGPIDIGEPLRTWIDANVPSDTVIVASDAQATGYALHRATISLLESEYSEVNWSESQVRSVMNAFNADFLILYPTAPISSVPSQQESPFLAGLLQGQLPNWLVLAAENKEVKVYRRRTAGRSVRR